MAIQSHDCLQENFACGWQWKAWKFFFTHVYDVASHQTMPSVKGLK